MAGIAVKSKQNRIAPALALSCFIPLCSAITVQAAPLFSEIYIFGDSLSDTGNTEHVAPGGDIPDTDFTYGTNGRFTNDRVWAEYLSERLGLGATLQPSRGGGTNYAHGGAQLDANNGPSTGVQLQYQSWTAGAGTADPDALYVVWAGANDLRGVFTQPGLDVGAYVVDRLGIYRSILADLANRGAEQIMVPNLPNLGYAPEAQYAGISTEVTGLVAFWNENLKMMLDGLTAATGVTFYQPDIFATVEQVFSDPNAYGLSNITDPCSHVIDNVEIPCAAPSSYAFWDTLHPTSSAHQLFAEAAYQSIRRQAPAVPEPSSLWLLLPGLLATTAVLRRQPMHGRAA